jgi:large subunit ribosomal protein L13
MWGAARRALAAAPRPPVGARFVTQPTHTRDFLALKRATRAAVKLEDLPADRWHLVDATDKVVGRLATRIVRVLMGKHKPTYTPHLDNGDFVVVTNARDVVFTGKKHEKKVYHWHTGWPGGHKMTTPKMLLAKSPENLLRKAVSSMLPKNKLRPGRMKRLRIFADEQHIHGDKIAADAKKLFE